MCQKEEITTELVCHNPLRTRYTLDLKEYWHVMELQIYPERSTASLEICRYGMRCGGEPYYHTLRFQGMDYAYGMTTLEGAIERLITKGLHRCGINNVEIPTPVLLRH